MNKSILCLPIFIVLLFVVGCSPQQRPAAGSADDLYRELRLGYGGGDTLRAESLVQSMFTALPDPHPQQLRLLNNGLLQWMYTYVYAANPADGFARFQCLSDGTDPLVIPDACRRRALILAAYLGMQCGATDQALMYLEQGLSMPEYPTPDERYADFTFAAAVYSQVGNRIDSSIEMYERALAEVRNSDDRSGLPWVLSNLAELYEYNGRFEQAVRMHYESLDYFRAAGNDEGTASVYYSLAQLFRHLDMEPEARRYADEGMPYALRSGYVYNVGLLQLEKYEQARLAGQPDSVRYWLECADSCFVAGNSPVEHLTTQAEMALLLLNDPARLDEGIARLEQICTDTLIIGTPYHALISAELGQGYLLQGKETKGIRLLENSVEGITGDRREILLPAIYERLMGYFRGKKEYARAFAYSDRRDALNEDLFREQSIRHVAASRIRYETAQKEMENEVLQQKTILQRRMIAYSWTGAGLLIMLLGFIVLLLRQRQQHLRRQSEERLARIGDLLHVQIELQRQQELLQQQLQEGRNDNDTNDVRDRPLKCIADRNEETYFRQSFSELYPRYLPALRSRWSDLTRTDELIAMLLRLGSSNDEIAMALNITKASVNRARGRMRKRLGLVETGIVLEEFLKEI